MFKLSIDFHDLAALSAFVSKMGSDVMTGTVTHTQPMASAEAAPATPAPSRSRAKKKAEDDVVIPAAPAQTPGVNVPVSGTPFPADSVGPASFTPGNFAAPAAAQPVHQPAPIAQPAPISAPMAAPQAPVVEISPQRKQYNEECAKLIAVLEQLGPNFQGASAQAIQHAFQQVNGVGARVSTLSDAQIVPFYQTLHHNVTTLVNQANAQAAQ